MKDPARAPSVEPPVGGPRRRRAIRRWALTLLAASLVLTAATLPAHPEPARADADTCDKGGTTSYLYCNPTPRGVFTMKHSSGLYYSYMVGEQDTFPVATSRDLINWKWVTADVEPKGADWWDATPDVWPMEVIERDGKFYMFYSAVASEASRARTASCGNNHFIGLAIADSPTGPFTDIGRPLMGGAPYDENGTPWGQIRTIDPNPFIDDDGTVYLYFDKPGGCYSYNGVKESRIYVAKLRPDLKQIDSQPKLLLKPSQEWEYRSGTGHLWNEAPEMLKRDGKYYLMYSANGFADPDGHYAVGYAVSDSPLGPFTKYSENPILSSIDGVNKAGHNHVVYSPDGRDVYTTYQTFNGRYLSRLGLRGDGTLYANGPYGNRFVKNSEGKLVDTRVMPKPSGAPIYDSAGNQVGTVFDHTRSAVTTASSYPSGTHHFPQKLKDGEIGLRDRFAVYDWQADGQRVGAWVNLAWSSPRPVDQILIYPSVLAENEVTSGRLELSDGTTVNVTFRSDCLNADGATVNCKSPAVVDLGRRASITNLKFTITGMPGTATGSAALSEISVLGPPA